MGLLPEIFAPVNGKSHRQPRRYSKPQDGASPVRYAADDWVAYTGPRGGKGWQHITSGEIVYGERPGGKEEASPEPEKEPENAPPGETIDQASAPPEKGPEPEPVASKWHDVGGGMWQHGSTGEVVRGEQPPSADATASVLDQARARKPHPSQTPPAPQPAAEPRAAPPKPKPSIPKELVQQLDSLPDGTEIEGWKKETPEGLGMSFWVKPGPAGNQALSSRQLADKHGAEAMQQAIGNLPPPPAVEPPPSKEGRPFTEDEIGTLSDVSSMFGIAPGDIGNEQQMRNFIRRTARNSGFNVDGGPGDKTDKTMAAAQFLASRKMHLEAVVSIAQRYGWGGGTGRELANKARHAGLYLVRQAIADGYSPQGNTEQEHLAGALDYLGQRESQRQASQQTNAGDIQQMLQQLMSRSGKKFSWFDVAMAVIGFYAGYQMVRSMQRRRRARW